MNASQKVPKPSASFINDNADFSLVLGGPLFQLLNRARLSGNALEMVRKRIIFFVLISWLPLLLLAAFEGQLLEGGIAISFLQDVDVHVRFLVAMPLLIGAELVVHQRIRPVVGQFLDRRLITEASQEPFEAAIASAMRLRNSVSAELLLIAFVYVFGVLVIWRNTAALEAATWYAAPTNSGFDLSLAGFWYGYVSIPVFQFLLIRWFFRVCIWTRFLWQVSRLELNLTPTHPDRVGGLGFLSNSAYAFMPLAVAFGALLAGLIANRIFYVGAALPDFKVEIAMVVIVVETIVLAPLLVFSAQLANAKRIGLREYGALAMKYVREFDYKWLRGGAELNEPLVGSADIQSLADLGNSFAVVQEMRLAPVTKDVLLRLAVATLLPIAPLLLTMMPLEELLKRLLGVVF